MISRSSNTSNVRHVTGRKIQTPDEEVISPHVKSMIPEEGKEKEFLITSPRSSTNTQKTKATTKAKTVKIRIPWWNELISKEESELKVEDKNAREDLIQECDEDC